METHAPPLAARLAEVGHDYRSGWRRFPALEGIDLELRAGEQLALVGPNGSGKSTLLGILAGGIRARRGRVEVLGGSPREGGVRVRVGWLPEDSPFPRDVPAGRALELLGSLRGLRGRELRGRSAELLERVGLAADRKVPLGRLSRGMLRRFGLAQAELHRPDLLLLDEPTAGLDAPGFDALDRLLEDARGRGAAVVLATHLAADLWRGCHRMAVLVRGRLAAQGPPSRLLAVPGRTVLELEGLEEAALEAVATAAESRGGVVRRRGPATGSLLELYRRLGAA